MPSSSRADGNLEFISQIYIMHQTLVELLNSSSQTSDPYNVKGALQAVL